MFVELKLHVGSHGNGNVTTTYHILELYYEVLTIFVQHCWNPFLPGFFEFSVTTTTIGTINITFKEAAIGEVKFSFHPSRSDKSTSAV